MTSVILNGSKSGELSTEMAWHLCKASCDWWLNYNNVDRQGLMCNKQGEVK